MWDIEYLLEDFLYSKSFRKFINRRFYDERKVIVDKNLISQIILKDGCHYRTSKDIDMVLEVAVDYRFADIKPDDIVIDIGANIGGFSIPASKLSRHVYAVEPFPNIITDLTRNVELNSAVVNVIEGALGDGSIQEVSWGETRALKTMTLAEIISKCGGCDFLKCDCEGGEWAIRPEELVGVRRVEMEVHADGKGHTLKDMERLLTSAGFAISVNIKRHRKLEIISAVRKG